MFTLLTLVARHSILEGNTQQHIERKFRCFLETFFSILLFIESLLSLAILNRKLECGDHKFHLCEHPTTYRKFQCRLELFSIFFLIESFFTRIEKLECYLYEYPSKYKKRIFTCSIWTRVSPSSSENSRNNPQSWHNNGISRGTQRGLLHRPISTWWWILDNYRTCAHSLEFNT